MCKNACSDVWKVLKACGKASQCFWLTVVLLVVPYRIIGVIALVCLEIIEEYRDADECGKGWYNYILIVHHWMGVPVHFYSVVERFVMMVACLAVYQVWHF